MSHPPYKICIVAVVVFQVFIMVQSYYIGFHIGQVHQCTVRSKSSIMHMKQEHSRFHPNIGRLSSSPDKNAIEKGLENGVEHESFKFTNQVEEVTHVSVHEAQCEDAFGMHLVHEFQRIGNIWCGGREGEPPTTSTIRCYQMELPWKRNAAFCEGTNIVINFGKIQGDIVAEKKKEDPAYFKFDSYSTIADCYRQDVWDPEKMMNHMKLQLGGNGLGSRDNKVDENSWQDMHIDQTLEEPWYLLSRDEDCENAHHSSADFINMETVYRALQLDHNSTRVAIFDRFPPLPFDDIVTKVFGRGVPARRLGDWKGGVVKFKRVIWHLESPASTIHPSSMLAGYRESNCRHSTIWKAYTNRVMSAFNLLNYVPPIAPHVTLLLRYRTAQKNVGRVLSNEAEIRAVLDDGNMMTRSVLDLASMSFEAQLQVMRKTTVLVGVHGAGLMNIIFTADESILLEIHPYYRVDRHFRHAARMSGRGYIAMRAQKEGVRCTGTSDEIVVDPAEFREVLSNTVRVARNFGTGVVECGLVCPSKVLALDEQLEFTGEYSRTATFQDKTLIRNDLTRFPC